MRLRSTKIQKDAVHHPVFARCYARLSVAAESAAGLAAVRAELLSGLSGRVIEIGAGNGLNFGHYPPAVSEVVAIEPERTLRQLAVRSALRAGIPVDVVPGTAEALPVKSEAFDGAVASLVLCTVRDVQQSLAEIGRVLRPGVSCASSSMCGPTAVPWQPRSAHWTGLSGRCWPADVTPRATLSPRSKRPASWWRRTGR